MLHPSLSTLKESYTYYNIYPSYFFTVHMNKSIVVIFATYAKHPIIFNWPGFYPLELHFNKTVSININIITWMHFVVFGLILLLWYISKTTWRNRGIITIWWHRYTLNFTQLNQFHYFHGVQTNEWNITTTRYSFQLNWFPASVSLIKNISVSIADES